MIFENKVKEYLTELKNNEILIDADIIGINENLKTSKCIGRFLENGVINEKLIYIYEHNDVLVWYFLNALDSDK
jgi:hypothetical protein